jgi:CHAT domain-containing protein
MPDKIFILISFSLLLVITSPAQSFSRDSLWERLMFISNSLKGSAPDELKLLLKMNAGTNQFPYRDDSAHTYLLSKIGTLYSRQGEFLKAVQYYRKAIDIINANINNPLINPDQLIFNYYTLNKFYDSLKRVSEMIEAMDSCISISRRRGVVNIYSLAALYKKTVYLFDVGDYSNCIEYAIICEMSGWKYASGQGKKDYNDGMLFASSSLVWNVNAQLELRNYGVAEKLLNDKLVESPRTGRAFNLGTLHEQLAEVQVAKGNYDKALDYYNKAFAIEKKAGHIISCKIILNNIGYNIYFKHDNNYDKALFYLKRALSLVNRDKLYAELNSVETLNILASIGDVYMRKGLYDSAFVYFQLALDQIKPGISESELLHSRFDEFARQKKIGYLTNLLLDKGDAFQERYKATGKLNDIKEAVRVYKVTDQLLDKIKTEQSDIQSKLFWRSDSRRLYEHAIEACYAYNNTEDGFYFFEKSRAVLLNDQLNEQRWLGEEDILRQTQIKREILRLNKSSDGLDKDSHELREIQNELFNAKQELTQLQQVIKIRDPLYYQSFIDQKVNSIQDLREKILSDHQAFVEIFSGDSAGYVFVVTAGKVDFTKMNKKTFDSLSRSYMTFISDASAINSHWDEFTRVSNQLFRLIFKNGNLPRGRIVISPDGQYFPFEALVINQNESTPSYFLNDYTVSYTYSAKYLMNQFSENTNSASFVFLGVAPVRYPGGMQLASLNGSDQSLSLVQSYFSQSKSLVYGDATKSGFMSRFSKYKIIQLYAHASAGGKNNEPVIYFADSALFLSELLGEDKPATRLIVLSACETGEGKLYKGEGVFGFNRGFAALGIPSSISNLWSVDDKSTYRLTELFYKYLARNMPIDLALRQAKIEFMNTGSKENQLPFFWAAPILIGKNEALELGKSIPWNEILLVGLVMGLIGLTAYQAFNFLRKKITATRKPDRLL